MGSEEDKFKMHSPATDLKFVEIRF